jgi:hypothetical protein
MMVSVTPGHKRIEEGSISSMLTTLGVITDLAKAKNIPVADLSPEDLRAKLRELPYEQLYHNLNPKTIDAVRNDHLPLKLSKDAFEFVCRNHMRNVLSQPAFKDLDQGTVASLIENAPFVDKIEKVATELVKSGKIPKEAIQGRNDAYHPFSLLQAAGIREYTENVGSLEVGPQWREKLEKSHKQGAPIGELYGSLDDAVCIAILTGDPAFISTTCLRGSLPSPEGLTKKQYERELALYYKYVHSPPGTLILENTDILNAGEGLSWLYSTLDDFEQEEGYEEENIEARLANEVRAHDRQISFNSSVASEKNVHE